MRARDCLRRRMRVMRKPVIPGNWTSSKNQTRARFLSSPDGLVRIARLPDDLIAAGCFQHPAQAGAKHRMIVDQQHSPC